MITMYKRWTPEELDFLRDALNADKSLTEMASDLGRTAIAVQQTREYKSRIAAGRRLWTPEELDFLRDALDAGRDLAGIASDLGRSRDVVRKNPIYRKRIASRQKTWTSDEIVFLVESRSAGKSVAEIASALSRTVSSVNNAISANRISPRGKRWSARERDYLRDAVSAGTPAAEIALALGRTCQAVSAQISLQGLTRFSRKKWTAEETAYLLEALASGTDVQEIATALGRNCNSVVCAANKNGITTGKKAFVPCKLGDYDVLAVELPIGRNRKALVRCPNCNREQWMSLKNLRHNPGKYCGACFNRARNQAPPRFRTGEIVGNFIIVERLNEKNGGWQYRVRDQRCWHEKVILDKPSQLFHGALSLCVCPIRTTREGYIHWFWTLPNGKPIYLAEHRLVMEQHLGRELYADENVHHVNGVRDDNRLPNLELWSTYQPSGQRVEDKITWAAEMLTRYRGDEPYADLVRALLGGL